MRNFLCISVIGILLMGLFPEVAASGFIRDNSLMLTSYGVPYFQDFDDSPGMPPGWGGTMEVTAAHGTSESNGLAFNLYNDPNPISCFATSPEINLSVNPCRLVFDYRITDWENYPDNATVLSAGDKIEIQVSTDNGATYSTIHTINQSNHIASSNFAQKSLPLTATASGLKIRFLCTWGSGDYFVDIDNFLIEETPSCTSPVMLPATNITSSGFSIGWTGAPVVDIEYGLEGYTPGSGVLVPQVSTNPYVFTGLNPMTSYDVYFRQNCGSGSYSTWTGPLTVTTTDQHTAYLYPVNMVNGTGYISNLSYQKHGPGMNTSTSANDTSGRAYLKFDITGLPAGALLSKATISYYNYFREGNSSAINNIYPLVLDPVTATGQTLYNDCGDGLSSWSGTWGGTAPVWIHSELNEDGLAHITNHIGSGWAGFGIVRGSSSLFQFSGYNNAFKPVLKVEYHIPTTPVFQVTPVAHDFGQVHLGVQSPPKIFTIMNIGIGTLIIDAVSLDGTDATQFIRNDGNNYPKSLGAGESCVLNVVFGPTATGNKLAYLKITENGNDHLVPLSGTGYLNGPQNLVATPVAGSFVHLAWDAPLPSAPNKSTVSYTVHRGSAPGVYTTTFAGISETTYTDVSTIPSTLYYYMVSAIYSSGSANSNEASVTTFSGCPVPTALSVSNISTNSALIGWNANGTTTWQIEWGPTGFSQGAGTLITTGVTNPYTLNGLSSGTAYDFYIRSKCGTSTYSAWVGPTTFSTICPVYTAPFTENFEGTTFPPACWSRSTDESEWIRSSTASGYGIGTGSAFAGFLNISSPTPFHLMTLTFNASGLSLPELQFDYAYATYSGEIDSLLIYYSTNGGASYAMLQTMAGGVSGILNTGGVVTTAFVPSANQWGSHNIALPAGANKIRFTAISAWGNNLFIDNVKIKDAVLPIGLSAALNNVTCNSAENGVIDLTVTGGVTPYSYLWNNGSQTQDLTGLSAGNYDVTVTDATNVTASGGWVITEPTEVSFIGQSSNVTCYGGNNGSFSIVQTLGGTPPYNYLWNTGATTSSISGLTAGQYSVTVSDANGCTATGTPQILQPSEIILTATVVKTSCPQSLDGSINLTVNGGTPPYAYLWSNGSSTEDISGLAVGSYTVTVSDGNGCLKTASYAVASASNVCPVITVTGNVTTTACYNANQIIYVAGTPTTFTVQVGGSATFIAGQKIVYYPGTKVFSGGYMRGYIAPNGPWCSSQKITEVISGPEELPISISNNQFTLFPNPTNGNFTLVQKSETLYNNLEVEIYSMNGKVMMTASMIGEKQHEFNVHDLPAGLYFVKILTERYVETIKLVKTK